MMENGRASSNAKAVHPNGKSMRKSGMKRPFRDDKLLFEEVFPETNLGKLLRGLVVTFLIKQEHRIGWARKSACDDAPLLPHPNETVAAHQWGVSQLIMIISREEQFQEEIPVFDRLKAIEMALTHDIAELITGDITPVDGISPEEKHRLESEAMQVILGCFPEGVKKATHHIYQTYEERKSLESKFVKDCDKLDFMIHAFMLERQGFTGFAEFYVNSKREGFSTKIATDLADLLIKVRNDLYERNLLYTKSC